MNTLLTLKPIMQFSNNATSQRWNYHEPDQEQKPETLKMLGVLSDKGLKYLNKSLKSIYSVVEHGAVSISHIKCYTMLVRTLNILDVRKTS